MDASPPTPAETPAPAGLSTRTAVRTTRSARWPAWAALLLCLLGSGIMWWKAIGWERELDEAELRKQRADVKEWVEKRLDVVRWSLVACGGLYASSDTVERSEFETFAKYLLDPHLEWVTGLQFVRSVPREEIPALEAEARRERAQAHAHARAFSVWPDVEDPRPVAAVVVYAEPEKSTSGALGFDAVSDREFRVALEEARASFDVVMTGGIRLPWDPDGSTSVAVARYAGPARPAEGGRPARPEAWILATVNLQKLLSSSYGEGRPHPEIDVQVLQRERRGGPDVVTHGVILPWPANRFRQAPTPEEGRLVIEFGRRTWELEFRVPPGYDPSERHGTPGPGLVLALGLALTGLVGAVLGSVGRTGQRAERLAQRMTAALQASETAQRTTLRTVPDGLVVVDDAGVVVEFNPAAERLFGWPRAEILGRDVRTLFAERSVHAGDSIFGWRERPLGEGAPAEVSARRRDGRVFTAEVHARDATVEGRRQVTALFRDVTERRRAEEERRHHQTAAEEQRALSDAQARRLAAQARELEQARDQADASARAKSEFLAAVSHEIRTPLNGILGMAHILLESGLPSEQEECARTIRTSAEALLAILNDILDVSKIEAGRILLESAPFDLRAACDDVLDLMAPEAALKGLELVQRFAPGTPRRVVGDAGRFRQVLLNLVHNAVKFTERGHVFVDVRTLETSAQDAVLEVRVEDTGIGIPQDKVLTLFRRFAQADSSTTRRYGGTGLGLLICRLLVERMGGVISVESVPGTGTTFRFTLRMPRAPQAETEPPPSGDLAGRPVLLVAESEVLRRVLREEAQTLGATAEEASGSSAGLAALGAAATRGEPFAAAFLFAGAGDTDAAGFVRSVRADPAVAGTALALVAAAPRQGGARAAEDAGFDAYLVRPLRHEDFRDALAALVRKAGAQPGPFVTRQALSAARRGAAGGEGEGAVARTRRRVLLAEDNAVNQKVAARMLERLNCVVDVAANGREAVEMADRFAYDVVFLDCQMPVMDGYEAAREIRRREAAGRHIPLVALTAHALDEDRQRCLEAGMDEYLRKPVSPDDLSRTLLRFAPHDEGRRPD